MLKALLRLSLLSAMLMIAACGTNDTDTDTGAAEGDGADTEENMDAPLGADAIEAEGGLRYVDDVVGDGAEAASGSAVSVHYTGTFEDGSKFDSSHDRGVPFDFTLGQGDVIQGWDQGVVGMKVGGKRRLWIPSDLAYGESGFPGAIPPNANLLFEVELVEAE